LAAKTHFEVRGIAMARVAIGGLHCLVCARRVEHLLVLLRGVSEARVHDALGMVVVRYDPARVTQDDLFSAVACAGRYAERGG